jgi:citronellol/citronellal dehydrogenase
MSDGELAARPSALAGNLYADRVVLVTGGGSGIGRTTAWLAARLGARVIVAGRSLEKLQTVAQALCERGLHCEARSLDIRNRPDVDALVSAIHERQGRLDLLVNSAGGQFPQAAIDFSEKGWQAVIDTNLNGTFNVMQSAARAWRAASAAGSIVSVVVSPRGLHQVAHTLAARAGVVAFSEAVAVEWAPLGIRVNCVAPGSVVSEGWAVYPPSVRARYPQACPERRAGSPWEIAEAILYLGSPAAGFVTGQTLHVNGGSNLWGETWTAGKPAWFVEATEAWQTPGV